MNRSTARVAISVAGAFGWFLVAGVAIGAVWPDRLSGAPFGIAAALSLVLITVFQRLQRTDPLPDEASGTIPWFSGAAHRFGMSAEHLTRLATSAAWNPHIVVAFVWTPLWLLLTFIAFLWANAAVALFR